MVSAATKATRRASRAARIDRRIEVWRLRSHGWSEERIAVEVGVHQSTVSRDLAWAAKKAIESLVEEVAKVKVEQVQMLYHMADELLQEWERSKGAMSRRSVRQLSAGNPGSQEEASGLDASGVGQVRTDVAEIDRLGDRSFISEARACLTDVRRIMGADAPLLVAQRVDIGGGPITVREVVVELKQVPGATSTSLLDPDNLIGQGPGE